MIRLVDAASYAQWEAACPHDAFGCRAQSAARLYFSFPFAGFWLQTGTDETPLTILAKVEGAWTVAPCIPALPVEALEELTAFLKAVGGQTVLCPRNLAESLPFSMAQHGEVLGLYRELSAPDIPPNPEYPRLKDVHTLLCSCRKESFCVPPWEPFLLDVSHRLRHGGAELAWIEQDNQLAACALTVAQTPSCAVLGGVAVLPAYRRQGLGSRVVRQLFSRIPQPDIVLFRAEEENQAFYSSLGFTARGQWAELTL